MKRWWLLLLLLVLAGCTPRVIESGPWAGCEVTYDAQVNCPWGNYTYEPSPSTGGETPALPPIVDPDPEEPNDPEEPDNPEEPNPPEEDPEEPEEPEHPEEDPPTEECKPGHGYGDPNHCHDGPPGRE